MRKRERSRAWSKELQKGYLRLLTLMLLRKGPTYGYKIMRAIEDRTLGLWRPTAGGMYSILKRMENADLVRSKCSWEVRRRRRVYHITTKGKRALGRVLQKHKIVVDAVNQLYAEFALDLLGVVPSENVKLSLFREFLSEEGMCASTPQDKRQLLKSVKTRLEEAKRMIDLYITRIDTKLEHT